MKTLEFYQKALLTDPSLEQAQAIRKAFFASGGSSTRWRHVKTGSIYYVSSTTIREKDLVVLINYFSQDQSGVSYSEKMVWTRPLTEFLDGRFEPYDGK